MRRAKMLFFTLGLALCVSGHAWAGIVYSNLGSGGSVYDGVYGWYASTVSSGNPGLFQPAFSFTPAATTYFTELDLPLQMIEGANAVTVELLSDSSGIPGAVLESWSVTGLPTYSGSCCALQTLSGDGTIPLFSGTPYYVAVLPNDINSDTWALWNLNDTGATGNTFENQGTGWFVYETGQPAAAFEVQGNTPEPGTAALMLAAAAVALFGKLRRR